MGTATVVMLLLLSAGALSLAFVDAAVQADATDDERVREVLTCEQAERAERRLDDPWWIFGEREPTRPAPPPADWPSDYLPRLEDTGGGFAMGQAPMAAATVGGSSHGEAFAWSDVVASQHMSMHLADNPSDAIYVEAMLFLDEDHANVWIDLELACEGGSGWDCSYYPNLMVHSGRVVTLFRGAYEPHDGKEGTMRMYGGMENAATAVAERVDGEFIACDWAPQTEQLLTPPPTPPA